MKFALMGYVAENQADWGKPQSIVQLCKKTKKIGLDGIDWLGDSGINPKEIRRITDDFGFPSVCFTPLSVDLNFPAARDRHAGLEGVKKASETAAILGTDKIMLPVSGKPEFTREESRRNVIAGLVEAVEIAASFRLTLTIEHYGGDQRAPFRISDDVNEAVRAAPDLRITYDSGNVWFGGENPVDGFLRSRENIVHVHFKDWEPAIDSKNALIAADGKKYAVTTIGRGLVDHTGILQAMQQSHYTGYVDLEFFEEAGLAESLEYVRKSLRR